MNVPFEGGCHCRAIRYSATQEPAMAAHCHCTDCQKTTGSAFATVLMVTADAVTLNGEAKGYKVTGDGGGTVTRYFCPDCGSPVYSEVSAMPGMLFIKAGSLDDACDVSPVMQMWTKSKRVWGALSDALPGFEGNPPQG